MALGPSGTDPIAYALGVLGTSAPARIATTNDKEDRMGISLGGILVIAGIVLMFVWSVLWGAIIALIGLIFFGGFARGRWY